MEPARVRIESHRLMRGTSPAVSTRIEEVQSLARQRSEQKRKVLHERSKLHVMLFVLSFIFASGMVTLGIVLFVRSSENLLRLVLTGVVSAGSFVAVFAWLRYLILSHPRWTHVYSQEDEQEPHVAKSVTYGFVALVLALLLAGIIMRTASAYTAL